MRLLNPQSRSFVVSAAILVAPLGSVAWALVATPASAEEKAEKKDEQPLKTGRGRLVSFQEGQLTLKTRDGGTLVYNQLPENIKAVQFDREAGKFVPAEVVPALSQAKAGEWIQVIIDKGTANLRVGERKQQTTGTFVSFKDQRLMVLLKVIEPTSFTKKYGNQVHFNKFYDDTPVYESIDGDEYKLIGTANKILENVKEGMIVTVHSEGDDNITLVQIGVSKK